MSDLINRQTAINTLLKAYPLMQREKLVEVMETVPAEVVPCKDCRFGDWYKCPDGVMRCYCTLHGVSGFEDDDFCSSGQKEEADE